MQAIKCCRPLRAEDLRPLIVDGAREIILSATDFCDLRLYYRHEMDQQGDRHWLLDGCSIRIERGAPIGVIRARNEAGEVIAEIQMDPPHEVTPEPPTIYPVTLFDRFSDVADAVAAIVSRHPEAIVLPFECPIRGYVSWAVARYQAGSDAHWVINWWGLRHRHADPSVLTEMDSRETRGDLALRMIHQGVRLREAREQTAGLR